ncbi:hypothetical protein [Nonomuraea sp. NPDC049504]|uniref:hypothetical protein n=1 Tax=Nonomuraea sp. NPDC049504 TaxID=3154729 RepID=UPI00343DB1D5
MSRSGTSREAGRGPGEEFLARRDLDADAVRSYGQMLRRLRRELVAAGSPPISPH